MTCVWHVYRGARPAGASHQFQQYYREGVFSKCETEIAEMKFCMKVKAAPEAAARVMLRDLLEKDVSPTEGVVWELRQPGDPGL